MLRGGSGIGKKIGMLAKKKHKIDSRVTRRKAGCVARISTRTRPSRERHESGIGRASETRKKKAKEAFCVGSAKRDQGRAAAEP